MKQLTNRRKFLTRSVLLTGSLFWTSDLLWSKPVFGMNNGSLRITTENSTYPDLQLPEKKRVPLGWKAIPVAEENHNFPTILTFSKPKGSFRLKPAFLRITTALDIREEKKMKAYLPETGEELGVFDIRFSHPFQPFEIPIHRKLLNKIFQQGIALAMISGTGEAWIYSENPQVDNNQGLQPHLLVGNNRNKENAFFENLYSMNSFSPFGWMGGSVQDALLELYRQGNQKALRTLKMQLEQYLDAKSGVVFENPHTVPMDGTFNSLEDFLPFAAIAELYPEHISIDKALEFIHGIKPPNESDFSGNVTTEGCYTLAYPLAAIAVLRKDAGLAQLALDHLLLRIRFLTDEQAVYQRSSSDGTKSFKNWGRGVTWYLLGLVKTTKCLESSELEVSADLETVKDSFVSMVRMAVQHQDENGMWYSYIDRKETGVDTSATAGIAVAIAWGCRLGLLDKSYTVYASKAYEGLQDYLSEDGFLRGVSQINRGGEALQESGYRVISQFGMGLMAQLYAGMNA